MKKKKYKKFKKEVKECWKLYWKLLKVINRDLNEVRGCIIETKGGYRVKDAYIKTPYSKYLWTKDKKYMEKNLK